MLHQQAVRQMSYLLDLLGSIAKQLQSLTIAVGILFALYLLGSFTKQSGPSPSTINGGALATAS